MFLAVLNHLQRYTVRDGGPVFILVKALCMNNESQAKTNGCKTEMYSQQDMVHELNPWQYQGTFLFFKFHDSRSVQKKVIRFVSLDNYENCQSYGGTNKF